MRLFEQILQNVSPRTIAREVTATISQASGGNIISVTAKQFLHSIMDAIGFNYYVTLNEIETLNFQWLDREAMSYRFSYDYSVFDRFQQFFGEICKEMYQNNLTEELIAIVNKFLSFCNSMDEQWENRFWEPFSLISYSLLQSMHKIRKGLQDPNLIFDTICHELFGNSQKGLGHPDSHQIILKGLCVLLGRDYSYFSFYDKNIFKFYSNCMEYEFCKTSGVLFVYMQTALENSKALNSEKIHLVDFLTDPGMIKAYCAFAQQYSKNQVFCLMKFLNALLSHLPFLECFSRDQVHIIFNNALHESKKIRVQAVNFYLTFMRKSRFTNKLIIRDIFEFLMVKANGTEILDYFIESLWDEFPYITELDPYLKVLQKAEWDVRILSVAAQVTYRVYKRLYEECDSNDQYPLRLSKFLLKLPSLLMLLKDKWQIRGILSNVYSITDFEKAKFTIKEFPIAADRYIKYAQRYLKKDSGEDPSIVHNTVHNMLQLMYYFNIQDEMEEFSNNVYLKYQQLISNLDELTESQILSLQNTLVMLSNIANTPSALNEEHLFELLKTLRSHLIESNKFQELSATFECFLDSLAIAIYSAGCIHILSVIRTQITPDDEYTEYNVLLNQVYPFLKYLLERLENSNHSNVTIVFIEAAVRALCDLYIHFNFKLERHVYHILVNCVNAHVFEDTKSSSNRLRQLELQKNILHSFNLMHKFVEIPVAITWKIVIHFGMAQKFEKELTELMGILLEYNSEKFKKPSLFAYIVPVAIFNLFQRRVPLHKFQKALKAHKSYVEDKISDGTDRIMKIHIVLTMVDMIERSIKAGDINNQTNRMELLSNMNILLTDIYQQESNLILTETRRLEGHALTSRELQTLTSFQEQLT